MIGAGHNGLIAAAYLAKDGRRVTVLERADEVGGILRGAEVAPAFIAPGVAHTVGRLRSSIVDDLHLAKHGLELLDALGAAVRASTRRIVRHLLGRRRPNGRGAPGAEPGRCGGVRLLRPEGPCRGLVPRLRQRGHAAGHQRPHDRGCDLRAQGGLGVQGSRREVRARSDPGDADGGCRPGPGGVRRRGHPWTALHPRDPLHGVRSVVGRHGSGVPERFRRQRRGSGRHRGVRSRRHAGARDRPRVGRERGRRRDTDGR